MNFFGFDMLPFSLDKLPSADDGESRMGGNRIINPGFAIWKQPEYAWKVQIGDLHINVIKGREPNAFNRFMQGLVFGFKWSKL